MIFSTAKSNVFLLASLGYYFATPTLVLSAPVSSNNTQSLSQADFLKNGKDAQTLNRQFATLNETAQCQNGQFACIGTRFAQCVDNKFEVSDCPDTLECYALPLVNQRGTAVTCDNTEDALSRIQQSGATGGITGDDDNDNNNDNNEECDTGDDKDGDKDGDNKNGDDKNDGKNGNGKNGDDSKNTTSTSTKTESKAEQKTVTVVATLTSLIIPSASPVAEDSSNNNVAQDVSANAGPAPIILTEPSAPSATPSVINLRARQDAIGDISTSEVTLSPPAASDPAASTSTSSAIDSAITSSSVADPLLATTSSSAIGAGDVTAAPATVTVTVALSTVTVAAESTAAVTAPLNPAVPPVISQSADAALGGVIATSSAVANSLLPPTTSSVVAGAFATTSAVGILPNPTTSSVIGIPAAVSPIVSSLVQDTTVVAATPIVPIPVAGASTSNGAVAPGVLSSIVAVPPSSVAAVLPTTTPAVFTPAPVNTQTFDASQAAEFSSKLTATL